MIIQTDKQLRPRDEHDFYPTPMTHVRPAIRTLNNLVGFMTEPAILDPGAGTGVWGIAARERWERAHITGVELRSVEVPWQYDDWYNEDYHLWDRPITGFDMVIGNPPYKYAEQFIRLGMEQLTPNGVMCFLLRLNFLEGQDRGKDLWRKHTPLLVEVCSERPSFTGNGKTDATAYALYYWRKGWQGKTELRWMKS